MQDDHKAFDTKNKEWKAYEIPQLFTHSMKAVITSPKVIDAIKKAKM